MKSILKFALFLLLFFAFGSCKEFDTEITFEDAYRISEIIEKDQLNGSERRYLFVYEKNNLTECNSCFKDESNEFQKSGRIVFSYEANKVNVLLLRKQTDSWNKHQLTEFVTNGQCILEKIVTRYSFPECQQCWKYKYKYQNEKLVESTKYLKGNTADWKVFEKLVYRFEENILLEYQYYKASAEGHLLLDYKRKYNNDNGICECWYGGIIRPDSVWHPTQFMEYAYYDGKISSQKYYQRGYDDFDWKFSADISYAYDINNNLIERSTSNGHMLLYKYEKGNGNAFMFFNSSNDIVQRDYLILQ